MRLRTFYNHFLSQLKPLYGYEEAAAIASMIFEHFAKKTRTDIITDPDHEIENEKIALLERTLLQLKRNTPVQYVIGNAWFMDLQFKVTRAVLIPRPETEELVKEAIFFIKKNNKQSLLDIGTGSGCIPISIKKQCGNIEVAAMDISEEALSLAKENAAINEVSVQWIQQDFLQEDRWMTLPQYDVIISNPPYIPEQEKELLDKNVTAYEPHVALFVPDKDPLIFYEKIAAFGTAHLAPGGYIFMEAHESYAVAVAQHFLAKGYNAIVKKDLFEKERMVIASRSH